MLREELEKSIVMKANYEKELPKGGLITKIIKTMNTLPPK